jgi:hypothetical protein
MGRRMSQKIFQRPPARLKWSENASKLRALRTEAQSGTIAIPGEPSGDCRPPGTRCQRARIECAGDSIRVPGAFLVVAARRLGASRRALVMAGRLLGCPGIWQEVPVDRPRFRAREEVARFSATVIRAIGQEGQSTSQKLDIDDRNSLSGRSDLAAANRNGCAEHRNRDARSAMPASTARVDGANHRERWNRRLMAGKTDWSGCSAARDGEIIARSAEARDCKGVEAAHNPLVGR